MKEYECDVLGYCPFGANGGYDCRNYCGLGCDEPNYDEQSYDNY
mgnify:CR=1 FL=1